jgi:hypothetical protein
MIWRERRVVSDAERQALSRTRWRCSASPNLASRYRAWNCRHGRSTTGAERLVQAISANVTISLRGGPASNTAQLGSRPPASARSARQLRPPRERCIDQGGRAPAIAGRSTVTCAPAYAAAWLRPRGRSMTCITPQTTGAAG